MIAVAILIPWLALFLRGRILQGVLCLVLQFTVLGWIPAAIWAVLVVNNDRQERRHRETIAAIRSRDGRQQSDSSNKITHEFQIRIAGGSDSTTAESVRQVTR